MVKDVTNKAQAKGLRLGCLPPSFPSLSPPPFIFFFQIGFLNLELSNSCGLVSQQPQASFYLHPPPPKDGITGAGFTLLPPSAVGAVRITELGFSRLRRVLAGFTSP